MSSETLYHPTLSIIIPTLNEARVLPKLFDCIKQHIGKNMAYEILVCDAGSEDASVMLSKASGAEVLQTSQKNKAYQMNLAAQKAKGHILYFLHADTLPPSSFGLLIKEYYQKGFAGGCFQLAFDHHHWLLQLSAWITRFNIKYFQFGDQSLFISKKMFQKIGGYNEQLFIMEDVDIITRIRKASSFVILPESVVSSARRYMNHGIIKTEFIHVLITLLYILGCKQKILLRIYSFINNGFRL